MTFEQQPLEERTAEDWLKALRLSAKVMEMFDPETPEYMLGSRLRVALAEYDRSGRRPDDTNRLTD